MVEICGKSVTHKYLPGKYTVAITVPATKQL